MRFLKFILAFTLTVFPVFANAASLQQYQPGFRLIDGTQLNLMVNVVNGLTGNSGTPSKGYFSLNTAVSGPTPAANTIIQAVGANANIARVEIDAFGGVPVFTTRRADGTKAAPTAILSADEIGSFNYFGANSTTTYSTAAARLSAFATENWSGTANGAQVIISTTPNTTQTLTTAVTIDQDQSLTTTSASANALAVGRLGKTTPAFLVDASTATSITGIKVKSAATTGGVAISAIGEASNGNLTIDAQGTGTLTLNGTASGFIAASRHIVTGSTAPALSSCGTGSPTIVGSDTAGIVTLGTSATGCIITFASAYTSVPYCVVSWIATPLASQSYVTAAATITLTQTSASGNKVQYVCVGQAGG